jgi:thioredoxin reductase (NADPH)
MKIFSNIFSWIVVFLGLGLTGFAGYWFAYREKVSQQSGYDWQKVQKTKNIIPVAIIGSGPAGLSAALYTSRAHLHTVVFQGPQSGGQLMSTTEVENWPGMGKKQGPEIMKSVKEQAQHFGAVLLNETIKKVNFSTWPYELTASDDTVVHALTVVICTGAFPERLHNVPGEAEHWGKGVTACAICDAAFFKDKDVIVVGGGDSAAEQALQLTAYARHITVLVRGDKMRASVAMQDRLKKFDYIKIRYNSSITEIEGDGSHVTGVKLKTAQGAEHMAIDGVFLAIGHKPNTEIFKGQIAFTPGGYIAHSCRTQETSQEGVFAAGDVSDERYRQAAVASGDGVKAALDAERFLQHIGFDEMLAKKIERKLYDPVIASEAAEITAIESMDQFKQVVLESKTPVIIDFYTKFCSSCLQMMPYIQAIAAQLKDKLVCVKVDIEKMAELKDRYQVTTVPYFVVVKDGLVVGRYNDVMTKREFFDFASRFVTE